MAVMAKTLNKPFYVVAESFKFVRMFPLNQEELPNRVNVSETTPPLSHTLYLLLVLTVGRQRSPCH